MQGAYRILLALAVVFHHLSHDLAWFSGNFAVLGFYALSGYLITAALLTNYGGDPASLTRFAVNRFLRLFPAYWAALAVAALAVFLFPEAAAAINPVMRDPSNVELAGLPVGWIPQLTMVGLQVPPATLWPVRLIPPAWSTAIEVYFYVALALTCTLSNRTFARILLATALVGLLCALTGEARWTYTSVPGVAVLFAAGAAAARQKERLQALLERNRLIVPLCSAAFAVIAVAPEFFHALRQEAYLVWGQYAVAPLVAVLAHATIQSRPVTNRSLDKWLADLSYPVFLLHFPVAALVRGATGLAGGEWVMASLSLTLLLAALIVALIEQPVGRLRAGLRQKGVQRREATSG